MDYGTVWAACCVELRVFYTPCDTCTFVVVAFCRIHLQNGMAEFDLIDFDMDNLDFDDSFF